MYLKLASCAQVPQDAWELDLVVSDSAQGGSGAFYDNNGGFDYHVPTRGSNFTRPKLSVVHVAVEMAPIAKVRLDCWKANRASLWLHRQMTMAVNVDAGNSCRLVRIAACSSL